MADNTWAVLRWSARSLTQGTQTGAFPVCQASGYTRAGCPVPDIPGGERIGARAPPIPRRSSLRQSQSGRPPLEPSASESDTDSSILIGEDFGTFQLENVGRRVDALAIALASVQIDDYFHRVSLLLSACCRRPGKIPQILIFLGPPKP